jgi:ABC-type bacteriocin/lantibiotic exporter with double-glycine peptidase domain
MSNVLISQTLPGVVISVPLGVMLIHLNWYLFLLAACISPLFYFVNRWMSGRVKESVEVFRHAIEEFARGLWFTIWMMDLTILQSAQHLEINKQAQHFEAVRDAETSMGWLQATHSTMQNLIVDAAGVILLVAGGIAVATGAMALGELISFYIAAALLKRYVQPLTFAVPAVIAGNESLVELYEILTIEDTDPYSGNTVIAFGGRIVLEGVGFAYEDVPVLDAVDLSIEPGTVVAIVGANGSGKTTIAQLILGLYRPQRGQLHADDYAYDELDIRTFRQQIGVLPQAPLVFPGTVLENITYGWPCASLDDVIRASEAATAHEFIRDLPDAYHTLVGADGLSLSGGERQKIAITRALLRRPRMLILDEPTNHLDEVSVKQLMDNLKALEERPAVLIISHDKSIIDGVEYVYELVAGRLARRESTIGSIDAH